MKVRNLFLKNYVAVVVTVVIVAAFINIIGFRQEFIIENHQDISNLFGIVFIHNFLIALFMYALNKRAKYILFLNSLILGFQVGSSTQLTVLLPVLLYGWLEFGTFVYIATLGEAGIRVKVDLVFILLMMSALIEAIVGKGGV
jgi:hypothetical protein